MKAGKFLAALTATALVAAAPGAQGDAGWSARVDALLLSPSISGAGFGRIFREVPSGVYFDGVLEDGLEGGVRFVLAKEHCTGLGVRFQYFDFDTDASYRGEWENGTVIPVAGPLDVDVHAIDIEVTQRAEFRFWDLLVSGGLRQGSVGIGQGGSLFSGIGSFYGIASGVDFDGVGPTVALEAQRPLGVTGLSIVGRARWSLLFGELEQMATFGGGAPPTFASVTDDHVQVTEVQFGMNYTKRIRGANASFGVFWEAQRWDSDSGALGDLALHGLSLQSGLAY